MVNTGPGSYSVSVDCVFPPYNVVAGASECDILLGVTTVVPLPIPIHRETTTLHICEKNILYFWGCLTYVKLETIETYNQADIAYKA